jgi:hypothetical protein
MKLLLGQTEEERTQLALMPSTICVGTNCEAMIQVEIIFSTLKPPVDFGQWDQLIECGLDIPSGGLLVYGCCDFEHAARIELRPGSYRSRICYGKQYSCHEGRSCTEHYRVIFWPGADKSVQVLKRGVDLWSAEVS